MYLKTVEEVKLQKFGGLITLLRDEHDWKYYISLYKAKLNKYEHFGVPVEFPCLVISFDGIDGPYYYAEHRFVYIDGAEGLLNAYHLLYNRMTAID